MPNSLWNAKEFCLGNKGVRLATETQDICDGWLKIKKENLKKKEKGKPPLDLAYSR